MSMQNLLKAFELIEDNIDRSDFEPEFKSEELIEKAENAIGFKFPPTYRLFLKQYGCGDIAGLEIYGLIKDDFENSSIPNGIWLTLNQRKKSGLQDCFLIISSTGDGFWYALDSSQANAEQEYPVVICGLEEDGRGSKKVNEDFGEFLLEKLQGTLSNYEG